MTTNPSSVASAHRIHLNAVLIAIADLVDPDPGVRRGASQRLTLSIQRLEESFGHGAPYLPIEGDGGWPEAESETSRAAWHARAAVRALGQHPVPPVSKADAKALAGILRSLSSVGRSVNAVGVRMYAALEPPVEVDRALRGAASAVRARVREVLKPAVRVENVLGDAATAAEQLAGGDAPDA